MHILQCMLLGFVKVDHSQLKKPNLQTLPLEPEYLYTSLIIICCASMHHIQITDHELLRLI